MKESNGGDEMEEGQGKEAGIVPETAQHSNLAQKFSSITGQRILMQAHDERQEND